MYIDIDSNNYSGDLRELAVQAVDIVSRLTGLSAEDGVVDGPADVYDTELRTVRVIIDVLDIVGDGVPTPELRTFLVNAIARMT